MSAAAREFVDDHEAEAMQLAGSVSPIVAE